jgi:hypothetical protein
LNPFPTSEILVLLLLIVFLFIFLFPSVFESKRSRDVKPKGMTHTQSEEPIKEKHKADVETFLGLEDIEKEEHSQKRSEKATPYACNPILVLVNIEG